MGASQNGWSTDPPVVRIYAGGDVDGAEVRSGDVAVVFQEFLKRYHSRVEYISSVNGYRTSAYNNSIPGSIKNSDHVSATAVDVNGAKHPNEVTFPYSRWTSGFSAAQIATIRKILSEFSGILQWGMDFVPGARDPMHFALSRGVTSAQVNAVANVIRQGYIPTPPPVTPTTPTPSEEDIMASLEDVQKVVENATSPVGFRPLGGTAVYLDQGSFRRWLTGDQQAVTKARFADIPPTDPFWFLPIVGNPGELFKKAGDSTGAAYSLENGQLRHIDRAEYEKINSPKITTLPANNPIWTLKVAG